MGFPADRDIKLLLGKYETPLAALNVALSDTKGDERGDDIWLLRFLMSSKGDVAKAAKSRTPLPTHEAPAKYMTSGVHGSTTDGDIIYIVRAGLANPKALLSIVTQEEAVDFMMFRREEVFWMCDEVTRKTGRLCKSVNVVDMSFTSVAKVLAASSKLSEIYYPQSLDVQVMINMPSFLMAFFRIVRSLLPRGAQERIRICQGRTLTGDISKCPFARARLGTESVPSFLGGQCRCPAGCIAGLDNDQKESNLQVDSDGMTKYSVAARSKHEVFLNVEAGATVAYSFQIEKGSVSSGGITVEAVLRNDSKDLNLLQAQKHYPDAGLVEGELACPEAGTCIFSFANGSSMWSRTIRYGVGSH